MTPDDAPFFLKLVNSPTWLQFIGDRNVHSLDDAKVFLNDGLIKGYRELGFSYYLVRTGNEIPIGACGFMKKPYLQFPDFGFAYMPEFQGQGYGFEAANAILDYGVATHGLTELDAISMASNHASIGLLKKLGFAEEGPFKIPDSDGEHILFHWCHEPQE